MRVKQLTQSFIDKVPVPTTDRALYWDTAHRGFGLQITPNGHKSFVVQYRTMSGKSRRMALSGTQSLKDALDQYRSITGEVAKGRALRTEIDPLAERRRIIAAEKAKIGAGTFRAVGDAFFEDRENRKLRSIDERLATFERLIYPELGAKLIADVTKADVKALLRKIEAKNGPVMAHMCLAYVRRLLTWYGEQNDDYRPPVLSKLSKPGPERERVLNDEELSKIWETAGSTPGPFGFFLKFVLLTATRKSEAALMRWDEVQGDDWTIPAEKYKTGRAMVVPLSGAAKAILADIPKLAGCPYVFTHAGHGPLSCSSKIKAEFDQACGVTGWTIHDLRRTARTRMGQAKVNTDIAERCLGHTLGGVRKVYDRWAYRDEKLEAFEALANLIDRIVDPRDNVVPLKAAVA